MMNKHCGMGKKRRQRHIRLPQYRLGKVRRNLSALLGQEDGTPPETIDGGECAGKKVGGMDITGARSEDQWSFTCRKKGGQVFREAILSGRFKQLEVTRNQGARPIRYGGRKPRRKEGDRQIRGLGDMGQQRINFRQVQRFPGGIDLGNSNWVDPAFFNEPP